MVYSSEHQSLAVLELRVHIDTTSMTRPYKWLAFDFDDALVQTFTVARLPKDWRHEPPPSSLQRLGDAWAAAGPSVILAVPSAIVPDERNLLLNPKHPDISKIHFHPAALCGWPYSSKSYSLTSVVRDVSRARVSSEGRPGNGGLGSMIVPGGAFATKRMPGQSLRTRMTCRASSRAP